jgi:hypothetical protein
MWERSEGRRTDEGETAPGSPNYRGRTRLTEQIAKQLFRGVESFGGQNELILPAAALIANSEGAMAVKLDW